MELTRDIAMIDGTCLRALGHNKTLKLPSQRLIIHRHKIDLYTLYVYCVYRGTPCILFMNYSFKP